jgi:uncharacterized protein
MSYWQNKVVLVTGGSAGLGRKIVDAFARNEAKVAIVAREPSKLQAATDELRLAGYDVLAISADVTKQADVEEMVFKTMERFGRIDVLVNNVGKSDRGNILSTTAEKFRDLFEVNFLSVVRCTTAAAPHLLASKGHIVNIGSLASKSTNKFLGAYPASKFPLAAYSQQLRLELGPQGVHTLLVCPGPIARDDAGRRYENVTHDLPESAQEPGGGVKLKRIQPEDLAMKILHACERRQAELVVPAKAKLLFAISQLFPSWGDWLIGKNTK